MTTATDDQRQATGSTKIPDDVKGVCDLLLERMDQHDWHSVLAMRDWVPDEVAAARSASESELASQDLSDPLLFARLKLVREAIQVLAYVGLCDVRGETGVERARLTERGVETQAGMPKPKEAPGKVQAPTSKTASAPEPTATGAAEQAADAPAGRPAAASANAAAAAPARAAPPEPARSPAAAADARHDRQEGTADSDHPAGRDAAAVARPGLPTVTAAEIVRLQIENLRMHPAAEVIPRMRDSERQLFLKDVLAIGVTDPIVVQRGGIVLDGRHRLEAAQERGDTTIPARVVDLGPEEQLDEIYRDALLRRHLSDDQRALMAADWEVERIKRSKSERGRKGGRASGRSRSGATPVTAADANSAAPGAAEFDDAQPERRPRSPRSREVAAAKFRVSEKKVAKAAHLKASAPDLADQVRAGKTKLAEARKQASEANPQNGTSRKSSPPKRKQAAPAVMSNGVASSAATTPDERAEESPTVERADAAGQLVLYLEYADDVLAARLLEALGRARATRVRDALTRALGG